MQNRIVVISNFQIALPLPSGSRLMKSVMKIFNKTGRIFYGSAIAATGVQQLFFKEFFQILFPPLPYKIPGLIYLVWLVGVLLFVAGTAISLNIRTKYFAYLLGCIFLFFFIFCYVPYELFISPYSPIHLGVWVQSLKELAYAGGAFAIAGQFNTNTTKPNSSFIKLLEKIVPFGGVMFSITMISFGVSHFYYTGTVENMVPGWIPFHRFWTYFAGIALIGSGISIVLKFRIKTIGNLLGIMIFIWFIVLHMPDALANPSVNNGNEVTSMFSALAFSGIAFLIANGKPTNRKP
jgi:uncharacterized membrane protein